MLPYRGYSYISRPSIDSGDAFLPFVCGRCGAKTSALVSAIYAYPNDPVIKWLLCTSCGDGSVMAKDSVIYPPTIFGEEITGLPTDELKSAYNEARRCFSINAFTACEQACRGILMHVAVDKAAKDGEKFEYYVDYLEKQGFVTSMMKDWVDLIRQHGNKATHKLEKPDPQRAESTLLFTAQLLKIVYEMPSMAKKYTGSP